MACNRTRLLAEIMLAIKISPVRTTEYKSIVMTAINAEGIKFKMDMDFDKEESSYAFRLIIDNDIELGFGAGKVPQVHIHFRSSSFTANHHFQIQFLNTANGLVKTNHFFLL